MDAAAAAEPGGDERVVGADRVLRVLKRLGEYPDGVGVEELARAVESPKSTVHRALGALRRAGLADQDAGGRYRVGVELLRIAFDYHARRPEHVAVQPLLEELAARFGETAHLGVLEGRSIVYLAKVDPAVGAVRLSSSVGGRNPAHLTGIGKCLLAFAIEGRGALEAWIGEHPLERRTPNSIVSANRLVRELEITRRRGFGTDDQESEAGVNCIAFPVWMDAGEAPSGAVSVSGIAYRSPLARLLAAAPEIEETIERHGWGRRSSTRRAEGARR
ncbi:MAG: IclR family transcriptional regulator [Actinomycetota bacterium]|nr:IclR family transcriptional regulator [Actinomycetota bacterium]